MHAGLIRPRLGNLKAPPKSCLVSGACALRRVNSLGASRIDLKNLLGDRLRPRLAHCSNNNDVGKAKHDPADVFPPAAAPAAAHKAKLKKRYQVSVDFGTARSGFAYQAIGPQGSTPTPTVVFDYPRVPSNLPAYTKTLTALLYEYDQSSGKWVAVDWGWPARAGFIQRCKTDRGNRHITYWLVERFKLGLCADSDPQGLARHDPARELPPGVSAQQATGDFLRLLTRFALDELGNEATRHGGGPGAQQVGAADVQWCLTVPSAWPHTADMRACALAAGMVDARDSPSLEVRHEGEAAAVYAHHALAKEMHLGERMLVMDMGGGTTDFAVMQLDRGPDGREATLIETTYRHGELVGATDMDFAFDVWLDSRLGGEGPWEDSKAHPLQRWVKKDLQDYMEMKADWEVTKTAYKGLDPSTLPPPDVASPAATDDGHSGADSGGSVAGSKGQEEEEEDGEACPASVTRAAAQQYELARKGVATSVPLPPSLAQRKAVAGLAARLGLPPGATVQQVLGSLQEGVDDCIELTYEDMDGLFDVVLVPALRAAKAMLQRCQGRVDKLVLAGGVGSSTHVARVVAREMRGLVGQVLVPRNAGSAVMEGGLLALARPGAVSERRAAMTYGERFTEPWKEGAPNKDVLQGREGFFTRQRFEPFLHKNDPIRPDQVVSRTFYPTIVHQEGVSIELWATPNPAGATYTSEPGCVKLVDKLLPLDPAKVIDINSYAIRCDMHFGRAEVTLRAKDMQTGRELHVVAGLDALPSKPTPAA